VPYHDDRQQHHGCTDAGAGRRANPSRRGPTCHTPGRQFGCSIDVSEPPRCRAQPVAARSRFSCCPHHSVRQQRATASVARLTEPGRLQSRSASAQAHSAGRPTCTVMSAARDSTPVSSLLSTFAESALERTEHSVCLRTTFDISKMPRDHHQTPRRRPRSQRRHGQPFLTQKVAAEAFRQPLFFLPSSSSAVARCPRRSIVNGDAPSR